MELLLRTASSIDPDLADDNDGFADGEAEASGASGIYVDRSRSFLVNLGEKTKTCLVCGTGGIRLGVHGTRILCEDAVAEGSGGSGGGGGGGEAPARDAGGGGANLSTAYSFFDDITKTPIVIPAYWLMLRVETTLSSFDSERAGGYPFDDAATHDALISFHDHKAAYAAAGTLAQYVGDLSDVGGGLVAARPDGMGVFDPLRINMLVLQGLCAYLGQATAAARAELYTTHKHGGSRRRRDTPIFSFPHISPASMRLYIYLLLSGGRFPDTLPYRFVWDLYTENKRYFRNAWVESLCTAVVVRSVTLNTVYSRLHEALMHGAAELLAACRAYLVANYAQEHCSAMLTAKTDTAFFVSLLRDDALDPDLRFASAKMYVHARSRYHARGVNDRIRDACVLVTESIPWPRVAPHTLRAASDTAALFFEHCKLDVFWKMLAAAAVADAERTDTK